MNDGVSVVHDEVMSQGTCRAGNLDIIAYRGQDNNAIFSST